MKKTLLALAISSAFMVTNVSANPLLEDRLMAMEKRLAYMEQYIQLQDEVIKAKDAQIAEMDQQPSGNEVVKATDPQIAEMDQQPSGNEVVKATDPQIAEMSQQSYSEAWYNRVEVGGVVEVEAKHTSTDGAEDQSDIVAATAEIGITAQLNDWVTAEMVGLYEEETNNDGLMEVDTALVSIASPNSNWFVNAGQFTLPFGIYDTNLLSDPITLDLGESSDSAIEFGFGNDKFSASAYVFQGDLSNEVDNYGLAINAIMENNTMRLEGHLGYISNLGESDEIVDGGWMTAGNESEGWIVSASMSFGKLDLIGEYLAASKGFTDAGDDKPSAYNLEAAYNFAMRGKPATVALAYQGTNDAENANWGLDENRILVGLTVELVKDTSLGVEYSQAETYAGTESDTITGKLAVEF